ncbi:hypothetical protein [Endozoicomonas ascidiicola]|uniref:hypothetical protein n=1 Tax=Endozoicomonas ascidiicola TaxID=1698521 RepID=UPI000835EE43|nr:hypothetical protein [Endozoicomonas ascidiicola]
MKLYQQAFGEDYDLGVRIPEYFEDQSYKNDSGPSFVYTSGYKLLKISVLPDNVSERDIEGACRYTLFLMETSSGDDYQEVVDICLETESIKEFEKLLFDKSFLDKILV